jgi:predicted Zn finger-like uncharacterized protein
MTKKGDAKTLNIKCESCQSRFKISEEKLGAREAASIRCPKCKNMIQLELPGKTDTPPGASPQHPSETSEPSEASANVLADNFSEMSADENGDDYFSDKPFDFAEEESKTALVCEADPDVKKKIASLLGFMEYHITEAESARDALKRMRFHVYNLIIVNEDFKADSSGENSVMSYLERLDMDTRRQIIVVLISKRYRTMDHMLAFKKSVNMILNTKHLEKIGLILGRGLADRDLFYRAFNESRVNLGLA